MFNVMKFQETLHQRNAVFCVTLSRGACNSFLLPSVSAESGLVTSDLFSWFPPTEVVTQLPPVETDGNNKMLQAQQDEAVPSPDIQNPENRKIQPDLDRTGLSC